ncbi:uncharacterized protein AMSG_11736 [Thecamonas trahens ATCC 50062]|uniref:Alkyl transferase n=1 Tax=Thecamonas trahens ATCC 50062 TaxID=461836 RepID=A0A0L0D2W8_THETB|nr:hypothetical protein AMSG_11736 [Thecamonas trahens ATCC 50062]KNC46541.1 hypothetical protein AMSG_11736 [Thecamonas trahens ATCC 50062]|eukprot:XP_013760485.1 hypothetical protein AMSG_11736 [Thecamonas trahens ATCC 50062]
MWASLKQLAPGWLRALAGAGPIPKHIAFIMDGNRRFASSQQLPRIEGHARGYTKLTQTLEWCAQLGVTTVSVYAFSIDNFKRTQEEVDDLLTLAEAKFRELLEQRTFIDRHKVHIRVVGDLDLLPASLRDVMCAVEAYSSQYSELTLNVCFSYTSTNEMAAACAAVAAAVRDGVLDADDVDETAVHMALATGSDPDIIVRTSGEIRLSNFLLYQAGHAQLAFLSVLWPDLSFWDIVGVIVRFQTARLTGSLPAPPPPQLDSPLSTAPAAERARYARLAAFRAHLADVRRTYVTSHAASHVAAASLAATSNEAATS